MIGKNGAQFRATMLDFYGILSEKLNEYQFVQKVAGKCELHIANQDITEKEVNNILEVLNNRCHGLLYFEAVRVDNLQYSERGKYKMVIQKL